MMPVLRRTWAPCGATPTLSVRTRSHEKVSALARWWCRRAADSSLSPWRYTLA